MPKVAFITGGNGITGSAVLEYLVRNTTLAEWSQIVVTSRSPFKTVVHDDRITFVPLDLSEDVDSLIEKMRPVCGAVTHAYFSSYVHKDDFKELNVANQKLFSNFLKYDSGVLDDVVQDAFGVHQRLFHSQSQHPAGVKVAVAATTVSTSQLRLFTNYNRLARSKQGKGYALLRPLQPSAEPYLWEIARSTAAAPGYFRPKEIAPFGALQDGGISANKPTDAALWELNCIWPETNGPHLVLSVGTGCQKSLSHELGPYRGVWLDGFIPRILRAFLSSPSLDAESSWMALWNRLDANTRERYHRLTCEFNGELPDLDDSSQIPRLIHMTKSSTVDYDTLKCKLWASRFFF